MTSYVISDLHTGSRYFELEKLKAFFRTVPDGSRLVLNGDTLHNRKEADPMPGLDATLPIAGANSFRHGTCPPSLQRRGKPCRCQHAPPAN